MISRLGSSTQTISNHIQSNYENPKKDTERKLHLSCKIQILHKQLLAVMIKIGRLADLWPHEYNEGGGVAIEANNNDEAATTSSVVTDRPLHAAAELFCSYQAERLYPRAKFLEFLSNGMTEDENTERFRLEALEQLSDELEHTVSELSFKFEIIDAYAKILFLTKSNPNLIKNHFKIGISLRFDPDQPDLLLTGVYNTLFTIPHFSSIMVAGRKLERSELNIALNIWALSIKSMSDLIAASISKSQLGVFCCGDRGSWGGTEGVHESILDIRREIDKCQDMPARCRFLILSRQQMFLEMEIAFYRVRLRLIIQKEYQKAQDIQA